MTSLRNAPADIRISSADARTIGGNVKLTSLGGANRAVFANIKP